MTAPVLPVVRKLDVGLPVHVSVHKSGGRDQWSDPLAEAPDDPVAAVWAALDEVLDPEIPISLPELGLVYGVAFTEGTAFIDLTFTATACPCMEFIQEDVTDRLMSEHWIESVEIEDVWDPPWTSARISDQGREKLRKLGVGV